MYSIYSDGVCIHSAKALTKEHKLLNPKLTLTDNAAGSLDITVPPGNAGYDKIERISSELVVKRNDVELWSGRVITEKGDFWNQRILTCEGELAYLNDTHQEPASYTDIDVGDFLTAILDFHNSKVGEDKQFILGAITVHENITCTTNYETTLDCINENVINKLGGHISIRKENGVRYIDYFEDYMNTNTQTIQFGKNLVDFTKNWDMTSYATVIIPRGARLEDSPIEGLEAYLTVESVNAGSIYVTDENAIKERGWIEAVVDFENITDPAELLEKARTYISDTQFDNLIIEVSAVDLHYLMKSEEPIKLLDQVRCVSVPHGLDKIFPVSQLTIPIDHPENATYTLGSTIRTSLTSSNKKTNSEIMQKIEILPSKETILKKAAENAAEIMNQATNGHITITKIENDNQTVTESLFITDTEDYRKATKAWRWNINGLAYYKTTNPDNNPINYNTTSPKVAITMDGAIVADFITTGTMKADRVRAGVLESSDLNKNVVFDLDKGELTIKSGEIKLGTADATGYCPFEVNNSGYLHAYYGKIGSFNINEYSIYNNSLTLNTQGLRFNLNSVEIGHFSTQYWTASMSDKGITMSIEEDVSYISWGHYNSEYDFYEAKILYTATELEFESGGYTHPNSIVFGAPVDLSMSYPFMYKRGSRIYNTISLTSDGAPALVRLQAADGGYWDVYIVGGMIMDR